MGGGSRALATEETRVEARREIDGSIIDDTPTCKRKSGGEKGNDISSTN